MKKVIKFGAGKIGDFVSKLCQNTYEIICLVDNNMSFFWGGVKNKMKVFSPEVIYEDYAFIRAVLLKYNLSTYMEIGIYIESL